jgi:Family of unknown function (DUF6152)
MRTSYNVLLGSLAVAGLFVSTLPAIAHHSGAGFNNDKVIEVTGTIKEFQFTNPHSWIQIVVEDAVAQKVEWSLEWGSPNALGRQGIRPSTFPPGAKVTARLHPMLNGAPAGGFVGAKFADGHTIGQWDK